VSTHDNEPTGAALRTHDKRVQGMLADPECVGELLLVGIGMARSLDLGDPDWKDGHMDMAVIAERVYGRRFLTDQILGAVRYTDQGNIRPKRRIRDVFFHDRRRYCPDVDGARDLRNVTCGRPMLRREGTCGRPAAWDQRERLADPVTGREQALGACSQSKCRTWWSALLERNAAELAQHPAPQPPANTGGVLQRHLPEINWWRVWERVDPDWTPPPEGETFHRPKLTLVVDDDDRDDVPVSVTRPALVVHEGGWR
jgi:hypothetical protein